MLGASSTFFAKVVHQKFARKNALSRLRMYWIGQAEWWRSRSLEWWATHITGFYVAGALMIMGARFDELILLELNEIGDLSAGVFGPVAFLWLVLGYVQQGRELKLSSKALQLQAEELRESVLQQTELARATNQSLKNHELSLEPIFHFDFSNVEEEFIEGDHYINNNFMLHNSGTHCEHVYVCVMRDDGSEVIANRYPLAIKGGSYPLSIVDILNENESHEVRIAYVKASGLSGTQVFDFEKIRSYDENEWYVSISKRIMPV